MNEPIEPQTELTPVSPIHTTIIRHQSITLNDGSDVTISEGHENGQAYTVLTITEPSGEPALYLELDYQDLGMLATLFTSATKTEG